MPFARSLTLLALVVCPLAAQSASPTTAHVDSSATPNHRVTGGITGATLRFGDGRSESGMSALVELHVLSWLTFSVNPAFVHATDTTGSMTRPVNGLTDVPLAVSVSHDFEAPLSPSLGLSLEASLPTGDTATGLGSGTTSWGGDLNVYMTLAGPLAMDLNAWRSLSGLSSASALTSATGTSLSAEATMTLPARLSVSGGYSADVGAHDSTERPTRSLGGGVAVGLPAGWVLTVDGTRGLTTAAPAWSLAIGVGTSFSDFTHAKATFSRLTTAFGRGVNRGRGRGAHGPP